MLSRQAPHLTADAGDAVAAHVLQPTRRFRAVCVLQRSPLGRSGPDCAAGDAAEGGASNHEVPISVSPARWVGWCHLPSAQGCRGRSSRSWQVGVLPVACGCRGQHRSKVQVFWGLVLATPAAITGVSRASYTLGMLHLLASLTQVTPTPESSLTLDTVQGVLVRGVALQQSAIGSALQSPTFS